MIGRDEGFPADPSGYPTMDDPSIIFSNGHPIQIPVPIPPATVAPAPPAQSAPVEIPFTPQIQAVHQFLLR